MAQGRSASRLTGEDDEALLVARARQRDGAAVRSLIQRHNRRMFRLARALLRDDAEAEDAVQDAYLRAFTHLDGFRGESSFGTWLFRIAKNEALGRLRRRRATVPWESVDLERSEPAEVIPFPSLLTQRDPEKAMARQQMRSAIERAIDELPEPFRLVLVARLVEEMSIEDTASLLDIRPETVKTRLHRARKLLMAALEKTVGDALSTAFPFDGARCVRMADRVLDRLGLAQG